MSNLDDFLNRQEDLDPELAAHLEDTPPFGASIRHPLLYAIAHHPQMNAYMNERFRYKRQAVERAEAEGKWDTYVWLHERPHRFDALLEISDSVEGPEHWGLVGRVWIDSENIWQNEQQWIEVLSSADPERHHIMDTDDRALLAMLPDEFPIYRGYAIEGREVGLSWTLNRARAKWFARRFGDDDSPMLASGVAAKADVIAHFSSRDEDEIVILPEHVRNLTIELV